MITSDEILNAWATLETTILRTENATLLDVAERIGAMVAERKSFNKLLTKYLIEQQAKEPK